MKILKKILKSFGLLIPFLVSFILTGSFYGSDLFQTLSVNIAFIVSSMAHIGASLPLFMIFGKNYRNVWHMLLRRAIIPILVSPIILLSVGFIMAFSVKFLFGHPMNEEHIVVFTFLIFNFFIVMAVFRALFEIRDRDDEYFAVTACDILIGASFLFVSAVVTPYFIYAGGYITTEFSKKGMNLTFAFLVRYLLSAVPSAVFSVPYFMMLNADRIKLQ